MKELAAAFQTSLTAMAIRYATLCTEPVAVVVSEEELTFQAAVPILPVLGFQ
jgi:hypothetical protein